MAENLMGTPMKFFTALVIMLLYVFPVSAWTQVLSDPTRPPTGINDGGLSSGLAPYPQVRGLQSVIISPAHCAAIIDGKTVELGAKHGAERLVEVTERGVVLEGEHGSRTLVLFPAVGIKITEALPLDKQSARCKFEPNKQIKNSAKKVGKKERK